LIPPSIHFQKHSGGEKMIIGIENLKAKSKEKEDESNQE